MLEVAGAAFPITPLLSQCTKIVNTLHDVASKLKRAPLLMTSIATECSLIHVSLAQLRSLDWSSVVSFAGNRQEQMTRATEAITLGCTLTLSVIEEYGLELQEYVDNSPEILAGKVDSKGRVQSLWKDSDMRELLMQLRGYQDGLTNLLRAVHDESVDDLGSTLGLHAFGDILRRSRHSRSQKPLSIQAVMAQSAAYTEFSHSNSSQSTTPSLGVRQSNARSESPLGTTASSVSSHDYAASPAAPTRGVAEQYEKPAHAEAIAVSTVSGSSSTPKSSPESVKRRRPSRLNLRTQNRKETLYDGMYLYTKTDKDQMRKSSPTVGDSFQFTPDLPPTAAEERNYLDKLKAAQERHESAVVEDEFDNLDVMQEPEGYDPLPEQGDNSPDKTSSEGASDTTPTGPEVSTLEKTTAPDEAEDILAEFPDDDSEFALAKPYLQPPPAKAPADVRAHIMTLPNSARLRKQASGALPGPSVTETTQSTDSRINAFMDESMYDFHPQPLHQRIALYHASRAAAQTQQEQRNSDDLTAEQSSLYENTPPPSAIFNPPATLQHSTLARPRIVELKPIVPQTRTEPRRNQQETRPTDSSPSNIVPNVRSASTEPHPFQAHQRLHRSLHRSASDPRLLNFSLPDPMQLRQQPTFSSTSSAAAMDLAGASASSNVQRYLPPGQARTDVWPLADVRPHDFSAPQANVGMQPFQSVLLETQFSRQHGPPPTIQRTSEDNAFHGADLYTEALQLRSRPTTLMTIHSDAQGEMQDELASVNESYAPSVMSAQWFRNPRDRLELGARISRNEPVPWDLAATHAAPGQSVDGPSIPPTSPTSPAFGPTPAQVAQPSSQLINQISAVPRQPRTPIFIENFAVSVEERNEFRQDNSARPSLDSIPEAGSANQLSVLPRLGDRTSDEIQSARQQKMAQRSTVSRETAADPEPAGVYRHDFAVQSPTTKTVISAVRPSTTFNRPMLQNPTTITDHPPSLARPASRSIMQPRSPVVESTSDLLTSRLVAAGVHKPSSRLMSAAEFLRDTAPPGDPFPGRLSGDRQGGQAASSHTRAKSHDLISALRPTESELLMAGALTASSNKPRKSSELMGLGVGLTRKLSSRQSNTSSGPSSLARSGSRLSFRREGASSSLSGSILSRGRGEPSGSSSIASPIMTTDFPVSPHLASSDPSVQTGAESNFTSTNITTSAGGPHPISTFESKRHRRKLSAFPSFRVLVNEYKGKADAWVSGSSASKPVARKSLDELKEYRDAPAARAGSSLGFYAGAPTDGAGASGAGSAGQA